MSSLWAPATLSWTHAWAQSSGQTPVVDLPAIEVDMGTLPFPTQSIDSQRVLLGKKVTTVGSENLPKLAPNLNQREILGEIPGLTVSEVNNESWLSVSSRGLGDPHESYNVLVLRDGLSVSPDPYGYPAAYYVPPTQAIEKIEFFRGGSSLIYGPQPGGALNFRLKSAPHSAIHPTAVHQSAAPHASTVAMSAGSFGLRNLYLDHVWNRTGQTGGLVSLSVREQDGFRSANNSSEVLNPRLQLTRSFLGGHRWTLDMDAYLGRFDEPGGLSDTPGPDRLTLGQPRSVTLRSDSLQIARRAVTLTWERELKDDSSLSARLWSSNYDRHSFRQTLGTAPAFGGIANGSGNVIQKQDFQTFGLEARWQKNSSTAVFQTIHTDSPFRQFSGPTPEARSGPRTRDIDRATRSWALAAEHVFSLGKYAVAPGLRLESIEQTIDENLNTLGTDPLRSAQERLTVPLVGVGLSGPDGSYANLTQGFKPPSFQDTVPLLVSDTISEDLEEGRSLTLELGRRGTSDLGDFDVSVFAIDYSNIFGRVGTEFKNLGASRHYGVDALWCYRESGWRVFLNSSVLRARFVEGPQEGRTPQYAPWLLARYGVAREFSKDSDLKITVQSSARQFGDDGNSVNFNLPARTVVDLAGRAQVGGLDWSMGIQNVFNQDRPSRVRSNGYEPAMPFLIYGGLSAAL
jgi:Fe(3+) dicitrate transport protein